MTTALHKSFGCIISINIDAVLTILVSFCRSHWDLLIGIEDSSFHAMWLDTENHAKILTQIYWTSIEHPKIFCGNHDKILLKFYWDSHEILLTFYRLSIDSLSKLHRNSIKVLLNVRRFSMKVPAKYHKQSTEIL